MATIITIGTDPLLSDYRNIRDGLNVLTSGTSGDPNIVNVLAGSYSAIAFDSTLPQNSNATYCGFANAGLSRFASTASLPSNTTISDITLQGESKDNTFITDLTRIYSGNKDGGYGRPIDYTISNLTLDFNSTDVEYIFQGGNYANPSENPVSGLFLQNVNITGTHRGSNAGNRGAYSSLVGADRLVFDTVTVDANFGGQRTYVAGNATTETQGGSGFLFAQGNDMQLLNSTFYENNYESSFIFWGSTNLNIAANSFYGGVQRKTLGETISGSTGSVDTNRFLGGSFLTVANPITGTNLSVAGNSFYASNDELGIDADNSVKSGKGIVFEPIETSTGVFNQSFSQFNDVEITGNTFSDVVPLYIKNITTGGTGYNANLAHGGVSNNKIFRPNNAGTGGSLNNISNMIVGALGNDTLSGVSTTLSNDLIIGAEGQDTLTGGNGADTFAFTVAHGTANADTITDFKTGGSDQIWLDDSIYTALTKGGFTSGGANFNKFNARASGSTPTTGVINFNTTTRQLFYDSSNSGLFDSLICTINPSNASVAAGDFLVF
jgi:hypothetical protein